MKDKGVDKDKAEVMVFSMIFGALAALYAMVIVVPTPNATVSIFAVASVVLIVAAYLFFIWWGVQPKTKRR